MDSRITQTSLDDTAREGNIEYLKNAVPELKKISQNPQPLLNSALISSIHTNQTSCAKYLLDQGANVHTTYGIESTVMLAARLGHAEMVDVLLSNNAEIDELCDGKNIFENTARAMIEELHEHIGIQRTHHKWKKNEWDEAKGDSFDEQAAINKAHQYLKGFYATFDILLKHYLKKHGQAKTQQLMSAELKGFNPPISLEKIAANRTTPALAAILLKYNAKMDVSLFENSVKQWEKLDYIKEDRNDLALCKAKLAPPVVEEKPALPSQPKPSGWLYRLWSIITSDSEETSDDAPSPSSNKPMK